MRWLILFVVPTSLLFLVDTHLRGEEPEPERGQAAVARQENSEISVAADIEPLPTLPTLPADNSTIAIPTAECRPSGWAVGGTFYYLAPYYNKNVAYQVIQSPNTPDAHVETNSFDWHFQPAFGAWLGWTSESGFGVRTRFFWFEGSSEASTISNEVSPAPQTVVLPSPNLPSLSGNALGSPSILFSHAPAIGVDQLTFSSDLRIWYLDFEGTYTWQAANWFFIGSAGGRYLSMAQSYSATLSNNGGGLPVSENDQLNYTRTFQGGGPTVAMQANWLLGQTGLSLFGSIRGSLLVGRTTETTSLHQTINDPTGIVFGSQNNNPTNSFHGSQAMPVAEFELGLQYGLPLKSSALFFRSGVINQTYFDAGNASQSSGTLSLMGAQFTLGLQY